MYLNSHWLLLPALYNTLHVPAQGKNSPTLLETGVNCLVLPDGMLALSKEGENVLELIADPRNSRR